MLFGTGANSNLLLSFKLKMTMCFHEVKGKSHKVALAKYIIIKLTVKASDKQPPRQDPGTADQAPSPPKDPGTQALNVHSTSVLSRKTYQNTFSSLQGESVVKDAYHKPDDLSMTPGPTW